MYLTYLKLNQKLINQIKSKSDYIQKEREYVYPWQNLESDLRSSGIQKIGLFGYGSLINIESALKTVNPLDDNFIPSIGFGMHRLFDYDPPKEVRKRSMYKGTLDTINRGLYNVHYTNFYSDFINGVYFEIDLDQIQSFRERELGYSLKKVLSIDWISKSEIFECYALGCENVILDGTPLTNEKILPNEEYWQVCKQGALKISEEFYYVLKGTSFLADGITTMNYWLENGSTERTELI